MEELIESIRVATASGASSEQKARGANACRAILSALDAEPGKPITTPNTPAQHPLAGVPLGQALDLLIAKLTAALPPEDAKSLAAPRADARGVRIKFVPVPTMPRALGGRARSVGAARRKP